MAIFIEKYPVTSSNKTIKTISIQIKLGTNVDWTIDFVPTCSVLNFLLPWQRQSQRLFSLNYTLRYDRHGVSQVQNFLGDEGTAAPTKQKGAHAPSGKPLMDLLDRGQRPKNCHFFKQKFSNKNKCWGPK
jgi:hypothetical protein